MTDVGTWAPVVIDVIVVLVLTGWYLSYSAARLDRLHHRVESARASLDAQLVRRAAAAVDVAQVLDPATGLLLADAAAGSRATGERLSTELLFESQPPPDDAESLPELEDAENDLTRALAVAFGDPAHLRALRRDPPVAETLRVLEEACVRVQLARRFHNDAVAQALRVRRKPVVRWARLAGHAAVPQMVEIDDSLPPGFAG